MTKEPGRRLSGAAALAGRQNAELVALRVGQDGPGHVVALADVGPGRAETAQPRHLGGGIVTGSGTGTKTSGTADRSG